MTHWITHAAIRVAHIVAQGIHLQLLIILCCLPITTYWGLAIPYLSPVGNLIFIPFLTLFILFGLLLLIGYFIGVPLTLPAYLLNQLTSIWLQLLACAPNSSYIALPAIFFPVSICGPILACYLLCRRKTTYTLAHNIIIINIMFVTLISSAFLYRKLTTTIAHIRRARVGATIIASNNQTVIIDWGGINAISGGLSWVQYQLTPDIYLQTGSTTIDYLIMVHPLKKVRGTLHAFARRVSIKTIIVPDMQSASLLQTHILSGNPQIISVASSPKTVVLGNISLQSIYTNESDHARRIDVLLRHGTKHVNLYNVWRHNYTQLESMES